MFQKLEDATYLGFDLSTQQLKAVVLGNDLEILYETTVQYDNELPEFRTYGGVVQTKMCPQVITAPTLLWVKALDMIMDKLRVCGVDFSKVSAISGSAQQHGTVYWNRGTREKLKHLDPGKFLHEQLSLCFSVPRSPVWMDSSTTAECNILEEAVGGSHRLAKITGSRAYERFSGSQIAKISRTKSEAYANTERIALVSSFFASLFLGDYAPIDTSDGSGMNLLDIHEKQWNDTLLECCGPKLKEKLGDTVPSFTDIGPLSTYFVERFGFNEKCRVIAFTGDNPSSLVGMKLRKGDVVCSLGTSDTLFLWLDEPKTVDDGHILCNPIDENAYMALLCFKNGSLTRERIRDSSAEGSWQLFNELLESTPRGNFGNLALYFDALEIMPSLIGDHKFNKANEKIQRFHSKEVEVRALIEGQFIAKRAYAEDFGFAFGPDTRIIATGGGSANKSILQVLSDVFNSPVYVSDMSSSAAMGAAFRAKHGLLKKSQNIDFHQMIQNLPELKLVCRPYEDAEDVYIPMVLRYRNIIKELMENKE